MSRPQRRVRIRRRAPFLPSWGRPAEGGRSARSRRPPCFAPLRASQDGCFRGGPSGVFTAAACGREDGVQTRRTGGHSWTGAGTVGGRPPSRSRCGAARGPRWSCRRCSTPEGDGDSPGVWEENHMAQRGCPEEAGTLGLTVCPCGLGPPGTSLLGLVVSRGCCSDSLHGHVRGDLSGYTQKLLDVRATAHSTLGRGRAAFCAHSGGGGGRPGHGPPCQRGAVLTPAPAALPEPASFPSRRCGCGDLPDDSACGWGQPVEAGRAGRGRLRHGRSLHTL